MSIYSKPKWNEKAEAFLCKIRKPDDSGWLSKQLPRKFKEHQLLDAEHWLIGFINDYYKTYGKVKPNNEEVKPEAKTLLTLAPKWLEYRQNDPGTKQNTWKNFVNSMRTWILDSNFQHTKIQHLDLETQFTPDILINWIDSIHGAPSSILIHCLCLRSFFNDCIGFRWLNINYNPMDNVQVKKRLKECYKSKRLSIDVPSLPKEYVDELLLCSNRKIYDYRKMRYLVALGTGLRDGELQGLTFGDVYLDGVIPHIDINKQLEKTGTLPACHYDWLIRNKYSKKEIMSMKNAIFSRPKAESKRLVPLHPLVEAGLRYWMTEGWRLYVGREPEKSSPIFPVAGSGHMKRYNSVPGSFCMSEGANQLRADLKRLGLEDHVRGKRVVFHSLRHTFASLLAGKGVPDPIISLLLGHAQKSVAAKHYIERDLSVLYEQAIVKLPLPSYVQLTHRRIEVEPNALHNGF